VDWIPVYYWKGSWTVSLYCQYRYCQCYPESSCGSMQNLLPIHQQNTGLL